MLRALGWMMAAVLGGACAVSPQPAFVTYPEARVRPVAHIESVFDYRTALASVMWTLEREIGVPPFPVTVRLYPNRESFAAALVAVGHDPAFARTTAQTMIAVGGHRGVLLNEGSLALRSWPDRTLLLAHEITHSLQYELGGGLRGTSDQWLREGFAEWVSVRILERLDGISLPEYRRQRQIELRSAGRAGVPRLAEMTTFRQWVGLAERRRTSAYAFAYFAVEHLIERHGTSAVLDYFSRFASSLDRDGNFRRAFGEDVESVERALRAELGIMPRS